MESSSIDRAPLAARVAAWSVASVAVAVVLRVLGAVLGPDGGGVADAFAAESFRALTGEAVQHAPWILAAFSRSGRWGWLEPGGSRMRTLLLMNLIVIVAVLVGEALRGWLAGVHEDSRHALAVAISKVPVMLCFLPIAWWSARLGAGAIGALLITVVAYAAARVLTPALFEFPVLRDGGTTQLFPPLLVVRDSLTPAMGLWGIFTALEMRSQVLEADRDDTDDA